MRAVAAALMWLVTTVLLAAALPAMWAQQNLVDRSGYTALAQRAAADPELQSAVSTELTMQIGRLAANSDATLVGAIARTYTAGASFPRQFGQANAFAHRWLFTDSVDSTGAGSTGAGSTGAGTIDLAPLLADSAFAQTLRDYNVTLPSAVPIPLTDDTVAALRPGALREVGRWGPWLSWALVVLTAGAAVLTLMAARRRGRALTALGVSALLVGAAGWAAIEYAQPYLRAALDNTAGNPRRIADVMVATASTSMHQWLNVTLAVGAGLAVVGFIVTLMAGLTPSRRSPASGAGTRTPGRT